MRRLRLIVAIFYALCLLGAQQAAFAHFIGHIGCNAEAAKAPASGGDHKAPDACTSCAAFAGLSAAPPVFVAPIAVARVAAILAPETPGAYLPARPAPPYASRAPPALL
ncbi:MAG: DUF2946 family protein [Rhodocyclaceae bacterium]|nr:DUF2946 family protein [Rhodocyclaceae bacterium]